MHDYESDFNSYGSIPFYMFGGFIIFATLIISSSIFRISRGREIIAFFTQQQIPVAKEAVDEMAPTVGNAAEHVFKGIAKGIKKGLKDEDEK